MTVAVILQARCSSTRLPGKVLKLLHGRSVLSHIVERVKQCDLIDRLIVATTDRAVDIPIIDECRRIGVDTFCGSEDDVLARYYGASRCYPTDAIVRLTADNLFTDMESLRFLIEDFSRSRYDYMKTNRFLPLGTGAEIFSFAAIESAFYRAMKPEEREHVTPHFYRNPQIFSVAESCFCSVEKDYSVMRLTLDTPEDWDLCRALFDAIYHDENIPSTREIIDYLKTRPELLQLNRNIVQVSLTAM